MSNNSNQIQARGIDVVLRPVQEVFNAVIDPKKLAGFFISSASGPLVADRTVQWHFRDVGATLDVKVLEVTAPHRISFEWSASGAPGRVSMSFQDRGPDRTLVEVVEDGFALTEDGVRRALQQTAGWTDFLCCMKAYLQHGMNLRIGREETH